VPVQQLPKSRASSWRRHSSFSLLSRICCRLSNNTSRNPQWKHVLFGHNIINNDLNVLSALGFGRENHNLLCVLGTQALACQIFGNNSKLRHIFKKSWVPRLIEMKFHVGGSDANLALHAMLLPVRRSTYS
jgi:hypothetical protein